MAEHLRRTVPALLVAATVIPAGLLVWLGVRTLAQERDLERQRRRERLELAAGRVAIAIEGRLAAMEERLAAGSGTRLTRAGIEPGTDLPLLYLPAAAPATTRQTPLSSRVKTSNCGVSTWRRRPPHTANPPIRRTCKFVPGR